MIKKHWSTLKVNKTLVKKIAGDPIISFKRTRNMGEIIGGKAIININVKRTTKENLKGKCCPFNDRRSTMWSRRVEATTSFTSCKNKKTFQIFYNLTCKNKFLIHLNEFVLCKLQYVEKSEIQFTSSLDNHRPDVFDRNIIPACRHFAQGKHKFSKHVKFTLTESITNTSKLKETPVINTNKLKAWQELLKRRENLWIRTLETLQPHGLNLKLNPEWLYLAIALLKLKFAVCLEVQFGR